MKLLRFFGHLYAMCQRERERARQNQRKGGKMAAPEKSGQSR